MKKNRAPKNGGEFGKCNHAYYATLAATLNQSPEERAKKLELEMKEIEDAQKRLRGGQ